MQNKIKIGNMKTYKFILTLFVATIFASCQQTEFPEFNSNNEMSSIECVVVKEAKMNAAGSKPEDTIEKFQGTIATNGIISFSSLSGLTDEQKTKATFKAVVPVTATIVEKDGAGNVIGSGIGGQRTISKKTYYFYVVAANGAERKYVIAFN
jgi:hypothetical protein